MILTAGMMSLNDSVFKRIGTAFGTCKVFILVNHNNYAKLMMQ